MLIDSHCHLSEIENPVEAVLNAKKSGVEKIISCSTGLKSMHENIELQKTSGVFACLGIHPSNCLQLNETEIIEALEFIELNAKNCIGIGETGLDFRNAVTKVQQLKQIELFERQIALSKKFSLPLTVHSRASRNECIELLEQNNAKNVLMHWFYGNRSQLEKVLELDYFVSIGPSVLSNDFLKDFAKTVPLQNLLLETDSPVEFNGKKALPQWIPLVAQKLAEIKELDFDEICKTTSSNAEKLFNFEKFEKNP